MPLSELRTPKGTRRRRKKDPLDDLEIESDLEGGEEVVKKERKKATEETLCMKCGKSKNPEVVRLE